MGKEELEVHEVRRLECAKMRYKESSKGIVFCCDYSLVRIKRNVYQSRVDYTRLFVFSFYYY